MNDPRAELSRIYWETVGKQGEDPHIEGPVVPKGGPDMNIHSRDMDRLPSREEAEEALALLRRWAVDVTAEEVATLDPLVSRLIPGQEVSNYPALARAYPEEFEVDDAYKASMPDLQNGPSSLIRGAKQQIQHVGISNFRLPIRFHTRDGGDLTLETSVTGTVSLEAEKKGINMSRIMRTFYKHAEETFSFEVIERALDAYKTDLESFDARIQMRFSFPMKVESLRSEHARQFRGQLATPHSQRSVARISVLLEEDQNVMWFEDLIDASRLAVPTETQVMVKREDEQAFAELNAANPIFVEDAARLFTEQLKIDPRVSDFRVIASHQESLHSHDAVSVMTEGETFAVDSLDPRLFASLFHVG